MQKSNQFQRQDTVNVLFWYNPEPMLWPPGGRYPAETHNLWCRVPSRTRRCPGHSTCLWCPYTHLCYKKVRFRVMLHLVMLSATYAGLAWSTEGWTAGNLARGLWRHCRRHWINKIERRTCASFEISSFLPTIRSHCSSFVPRLL